jgi:hypothetical protein
MVCVATHLAATEKEAKFFREQAARPNKPQTAGSGDV